MIYLYFFVVIVSLLLSTGFILLVITQFIAVFTTHAPFVPVPTEIENNIVDNLNLTNNSVLYDLGCGDARILIKAAQKYPRIKAVGVERAFVPFILAKFNSRKYKSIQIKREDIFKTDISDATHIFLYLYPKVINRLIHNIQKQCRPRTIILSCDFELENFKPISITDLRNINPESTRGKKLFVYTI